MEIDIDVNKIKKFIDIPDDEKNVYQLKDFTEKELCYILVFLELEEELEELVEDIIIEYDVEEELIDEVSMEEYDEISKKISDLCDIEIKKLSTKISFLETIESCYTDDKLNLNKLNKYKDMFLSDDYKSIEKEMEEYYLRVENYEMLGFIKKIYENN